MHKPHSWINIRSIVQAKNIKVINEVFDNHLHMHLFLHRSGLILDIWTESFPSETKVLHTSQLPERRNLACSYWQKKKKKCNTKPKSVLSSIQRSDCSSVPVPRVASTSNAKVALQHAAHCPEVSVRRGRGGGVPKTHSHLCSNTHTNSTVVSALSQLCQVNLRTLRLEKLSDCFANTVLAVAQAVKFWFIF